MAPAIAIGVLIIIFYPLRGVVIAKRAKLKEIRFVFTADNFLIEAPGNSKVEISKTVIKKVVFKSGYVMLHTRTGKQPIFVGKTQASELKMFLQGNGYRVV
ncbi:MAG TPA: hypothetical protein VMR98_00270 [Candidatus Polarisedimenticolaceae bacterium]|nr:hypothetical protein [Candidatus Polarisedimenticolaceae bacterium]